MKSFVKSAALSLAAIAAMSSVAAQAAPVVTMVGNTTTSRDGGWAYLHRYQQSYDSSLFSGPFKITDISFFWAGSGVGTSSFAMSIGYMDGDYTNITNDFSANVGAGYQAFGTHTLPGALSTGTVSTFSGSFVYDPKKGDLLINIVRFAIGSASGNSFLASIRPIPVSRAYQFREGGPIYNGASGPGYGLATRFEGVTVPTPGAALLLGVGLLGLAVRQRRLI